MPISREQNGVRSNALTERLDYFRSTRGKSESKWASASGFDPVITAEKNKILQVVKSF